MKKLNFMGIGPKVGIIVLPWLAVVIFLTVKFKSSFAYFADSNRILFFTGLVIVIAGSLIYFLTVPVMLKGLIKTKLITTGTYYLCCNPLYASIILLIIPGLSLMMNSWLILTTSIIGYILLKTFIKSEYEEMEKVFGDDFRKYRLETPEFFPLPYKKLLKKVRD
jgi:protein-S-isoprenylcysteine O-methyltransferase Ste14